MKLLLSRAIVAALALVALLGASECPLAIQNQPAAGGGDISGEGIDLGGSSGAVWQVQADQTLRVTLRVGDEVASAMVEAGRGSATLLGRVIEVADFCWRTDAVCPHQVLPDQTVMMQQGGYVLVGFNRRGPLAELTDRSALDGQLSGNDLAVPLAVGAAGAGSCALLPSSGIIATAFSDASTADQQVATSLQGRLTVSYDGLCLALGGNGALSPGDVVELSSSFSAERAE